MKMRHKAAPLDPKDKTLSPPLDQRLYVEVQYGEMTKVFWLRKVCIRISHQAIYLGTSQTLIAGKALDLICSQFDIRQGDSAVRFIERRERMYFLIGRNYQPRRLSIAGSDAQLRNDAPLSEQVDDGSTLALL